MNTLFKSLVLATAAVLIYFTETTPQAPGSAPGLQWGISDAHAVAGRQRRTRRRGVAVGYSAGAASAAAASSASASTQEAPPSPPPSQPVYGKLALGTVVTVLPAGCEPMTSGGVAYQHCGENYFRSAFQGNTLVYVSASP